MLSNYQKTNVWKWLNDSYLYIHDKQWFVHTHKLHCIPLALMVPMPSERIDVLSWVEPYVSCPNTNTVSILVCFAFHPNFSVVLFNVQLLDIYSLLLELNNLLSHELPYSEKREIMYHDQVISFPVHQSCWSRDACSIASLCILVIMHINHTPFAKWFIHIEVPHRRWINAEIYCLLKPAFND